MKPQVLWLGFALFLLCLSLHIIVWRRWHPQRHSPALLGVFLLPLIPFGAFLLWICKGASLSDLAAIGLLHLALSCAYIQMYPAVQAFSPTLVILVLVKRSMPLGMTREELLSRLNDNFLLEARVHDLVDAQLVHETGDQLELTSRGSRLIRSFITFRRTLGLGMGKG